MSLEGIDNEIERYTKKINEKNEQLKDLNLSQDAKRILESDIMIATKERTKLKMRKNDQFTTRHR
ncbi:MAG: hypothetical protein HY222_04610 [Thaumarchaeota archaeon]|nr:hypothetical protein [Nitrososphaerota archaeon]MBI3641658.1 hypothetical protein [Nitrososphaerota archaeon]